MKHGHVCLFTQVGRGVFCRRRETLTKKGRNRRPHRYSRSLQNRRSVSLHRSRGVLLFGQITTIPIDATSLSLSLSVQTPNLSMVPSQKKGVSGPLCLPLCWWWTTKGNMRGTGNQSPTELSCIEYYLYTTTIFFICDGLIQFPPIFAQSHILVFVQHVFAFNVLTTCPPQYLLMLE